MVNNEAAKVLVEYSQHIAHYAAIGDVKTETLLSKAAREHAWRLLVRLLDFGEAAKESDLYWKLLEVAEQSGKSDKEIFRLRSIAKSEDAKFMNYKQGLKDMLKEIRATERADPTGKKRQAEQDKRKAAAEERVAAELVAKKEAAAARRAAAKAEKTAAAKAPAKKASKKKVAA